MNSLRKFHWFYYVSLVAVLGLLVAGASYSQEVRLSNRRRAWEARQVLQIEAEKAHGYPYGYSAEYLAQRRWENYKKERYPNVSEIVRVFVNRTSDTNEITIHLIDVDGKQVTLWTNGKEGEATLHITAITPY